MTTNNAPTDEVMRAVLDYADQRVMAVHGRASKEEVGQAWTAFKDALSNHCQPAMPADIEIADWMACESRRPWVTNSLKARATALRDAEKRCRDAFKKDYMGAPARYVANVYGEAAAVIEAKLDVIDHARRRIEWEPNG